MRSVPAPPAWSDPIDHLLALDLGRRGLAALFSPGAAVRAARALRRARRVVVVTGFCVPPGLPETDGPPGAAVLGRALRLLGARVRYLTDAAAVPALAASLKVLEEPDEIEVYAPGPDAASDLLARERPSHLLAVERPGRARSGDYLSARGEPIGAWNSPIDEVFLRNGRPEAGSNRGRAGKGATRLRPARTGAGSRGRPGTGERAVTIAVGDGGNEVGMGNVRARLGRQGPLMGRIASVVGVDHLVVAGTSNWGAYGVVAAIERLTGRRLLHTPDLERRLVEACVEAGAVDGITRRAEPTVDGLSLEVHAAVVALLRLGALGAKSP